MMKRLAIIGASIGQLPLCNKAREMGLETYCFAWDEGAICKESVNHFIPISILEKDEIVEYCKQVGVDGVISNASELTASITAYVAEKLGLNCTPYNAFIDIQNKAYVREKTNYIDGLESVQFIQGSLAEIKANLKPPYVLKPIRGAAKKGVNYVDNLGDLLLSDDLKDSTYIAEQYVDGKEYSVESISYKGVHDVIQITEKISTGAPHFVELEHHQPALLSELVENKIRTLIPRILTAIGYVNGASHVEIKICDDKVYLIEVNPRGGGDYISNELIHRSTDCDYLKQMILVALGEYESNEVKNIAYSGVYFLSAQTKHLMPYFDIPMTSWMVERSNDDDELRESSSNYDRNGYIIYTSDHKIVLQ